MCRKNAASWPCLFDARMSEASCSSFGGSELCHLDKHGLLVAGDDHLRDAFTRFDGYVLCGEVNKDYANLAAVVGINGAGGVEHGDTTLERHAASGTNLRFVTCGQLDEEPRGKELALKAFEIGEKAAFVPPMVYETVTAENAACDLESACAPIL